MTDVDVFKVHIIASFINNAERYIIEKTARALILDKSEFMVLVPPQFVYYISDNLKNKIEILGYNVQANYEDFFVFYHRETVLYANSVYIYKQQYVNSSLINI